MRRPVIILLCSVLTVGAISWYINYQKGQRLFESLIHKSFCTQPNVVVDFEDPTTCVFFYGVDSLQITGQDHWHVENDLFGVYLILGESSMKLESFSDKVIFFSAGEFEPKFVRFDGDMNELTKANWSAAN